MEPWRKVPLSIAGYGPAHGLKPDRLAVESLRNDALGVGDLLLDHLIQNARPKVPWVN